MYGRRSVLPSVQASARGERVPPSTPWIGIVVLAGLFLSRVYSATGLIGPIVLSFALVFFAVSLAYAALFLRRT